MKICFQTSFVCVHNKEKRKGNEGEGEREKEKRNRNHCCTLPSSRCKTLCNMSDISLFHTTHSKLTPRKITGELLPSGHIYVNWNRLVTHGNVRRYVIHYKSLNSNRVGDLFVIFLVEEFPFALESCSSRLTKRGILYFEKNSTGTFV